ncbi:MAG TPA: hypothetical protein VGL15_15695 [Vicinamibacteria bacterium]
MKADRRVIALVLAALLPACGNNNTPTSSTTGSDAARTTETFTGTLTSRSAVWHTFTVAQNGTVDATLTTLEPVSTITVGLGIGTTPTNGCSVQAWNNAATTGTVLTGSIIPGTFCVTVYDVGNVTDSVNYAVTVTHP